MKLPNRQLADRVLPLLEKRYGKRPWKCWGRGVPVLVETILSQNTSGRNSWAGFRQLRREFRSWNAVAAAPVADIERCIRISGLSRIKAPRIQNILRQIRQDRGKIDLEFLGDWPARRAYEYLVGFDGVGPKTANCVLLFAFGMSVFPVDTHIHRIGKRMGLLGPRTSAEDAHEILQRLIRPKNRYAMHLLLIEHGRTLCKAGNPRCGQCPLVKLCAHGRAARRRFAATES